MYTDCSIVNKETKKRATTNNFIQFIKITENEKKQLKQKVPSSLLDWIEYLKNSSTEIRAESGLAPKKTK